MILFLIISFLIHSTFCCLPTQNVEPTTTTTTVAPNPCSACAPIYGNDCTSSPGYLCISAVDVGISYALGIIASVGFGDANTCSTVFSCPLGTFSRIKELFTGAVIPGPSIVIAYCQETGPTAGRWFYGIPPVTTPVEIVSTQCQGILSG